MKKYEVLVKMELNPIYMNVEVLANSSKEAEIAVNNAIDEEELPELDDYENCLINRVRRATCDDIKEVCWDSAEYDKGYDALGFLDDMEETL